MIRARGFVACAWLTAEETKLLNPRCALVLLRLDLQDVRVRGGLRGDTETGVTVVLRRIGICRAEHRGQIHRRREDQSQAVLVRHGLGLRLVGEGLLLLRDGVAGHFSSSYRTT